MISGLILVVSALLVGQSMAESELKNGELIKHFEPSESFDEQTLVALLSLPGYFQRQVFHERHPDVVAEHVANILYEAKNKATTVLLNGVTVQSLIDLNKADLESCRSSSLRHREAEFNKIYLTVHDARPFNFVFAIATYATQVNAKHYEYCTENEEKIHQQGQRLNWASRR